MLDFNRAGVAQHCLLLARVHIEEEHQSVDRLIAVTFHPAHGDLLAVGRKRHGLWPVYGQFGGHTLALTSGGAAKKAYSTPATECA